MPSLPNVPQVLQCNLIWHVEGDPSALSRIFLSYTGGPPSSADCANMAAGIVSAAESGFQSLMPTTSGASSCEVTDLSSHTGGQGTGGTPWNGTASGGRLAPGTAVIVSHSITRRYRGGKPRTYLPIGTTTDIGTQGLWGSASITAFQAGYTTFAAALGSVGVGCTITNAVNVSYYSGSTVVISPTTGRARNVPTLRGTPIVNGFVASTVRAQIGSQRRRNRNA